jgi:hypothetical protein
LKKCNLAASAKALKLALHNSKSSIRYFNLQKTNIAILEIYCMYKLSLVLYKTFNDRIPLDKFVHLNFDNQMASRQYYFCKNRNNKLIVGLYALSNRFVSLNSQIPLEWLNDSFVRFKISRKTKFLKCKN